ncbi:MAG: PhnD/SsuA/transferrin family substrate-binding protein [Burkholderiaceae bacterium]
MNRSLRLTLPWRLAAFSALMLTSAWAQALVFAINEGVTYRVSNDEIRSRYAAIAADLSKLLKQPVTLEPIGHYPTLRQGLADKAYDIALVHPAHLSITAMKNSGYHLVAVAKGFEKYQANFLVRADSPLKSLADLKGKRLGAPDEDSITSWMVRATLRDAKVDNKSLEMTYTRYQDAVPFFVENHLTHVGATAANSVIKEWQAKGGKVLAQSKTVPIKHVIAGASISPEQVLALREYFTTLDASEEGRKKLEPSKLRGFATYDEAAMMALGQWLGI